MAKIGDYQIPFNKDGDQLHYADAPTSYYGASAGTVWKDNDPFTEKLTYATYCRGRSAAYFRFVREDGASVTVFLTDFEKMVPHMVNGSIEGTFQFTKRGQNYGCKLLEAK